MSSWVTPPPPACVQGVGLVALQGVKFIVSEGPGSPWDCFCLETHTLNFWLIESIFGSGG